MITSKYFAGKTFSTNKEIISEIVKNKTEIIRLKKAQFKKCDNTVFAGNLSFTAAQKAAQADLKEIEKTVIANTYNWLDSHDDVHIDGLFKKSYTENKGNIYHYHDHIDAVTSKVGIPIDIYDNKVKWKSLGVNIDGFTTCLFMDSKIVKDLNPSVFYQYQTGQINQHSVGMIYVSLELCINDDQEKEHYAAWLKYIDRVGNKDKAIEQGYFFAITEAKLIEISAVVKGSNELTGMADDLDIDTEETDTAEGPDKSSQKQPQRFSDYLKETKFIKI
jgi:hypothetical protein